MAGPIQDDFNSHTDGDLTGQGLWSGDVTFDIQGIDTFEGAKAVENEDTSAAQKLIAATGTATTEGSFVVYWKRTTTDGRSRFYLYEGGTGGSQCMYVYANPAGVFGYFDEAANGHAFDAWAANTWYSLTVEFRNSDKKLRYALGGSGWTAWDFGYDKTWSSDAGIDTVGLAVYGQGGTAYFDYVWDDQYETPAPPPTADTAIFFGTNF